MGRRDAREACRARVADYSTERAARGIAEAYQAVASPSRRALVVE